MIGSHRNEEDFLALLGRMECLVPDWSTVNSRIRASARADYPTGFDPRRRSREGDFIYLNPWTGAQIPTPQEWRVQLQECPTMPKDHPLNRDWVSPYEDPRYLDTLLEHNTAEAPGEAQPTGPGSRDSGDEVRLVSAPDLAPAPPRRQHGRNTASVIRRGHRPVYRMARMVRAQTVDNSGIHMVRLRVSGSRRQSDE